MSNSMIINPRNIRGQLDMRITSQTTRGIRLNMIWWMPIIGGICGYCIPLICVKLVEKDDFHFWRVFFWQKTQTQESQS